MSSLSDLIKVMQTLIIILGRDLEKRACEVGSIRKVGSWSFSKHIRLMLGCSEKGLMSCSYGK